MNDKLIKAISKDGQIRAYFINSTSVVQKAFEIHKTYPVATAALGRVLTAAILIGTMQKNDDDIITIQIKGDGPLGTILATANSKGGVKGYVSNPDIDLPLKENGKLDVGGGVGQNGFVTVIKDIGLKEPYIGNTPLVSGEIGDDLTLYFARSEQVPTVVALGVLVSQDYSVSSAGGYIIQLMPNATENTIQILEDKLKNIAPVSYMINDGKSCKDIMDMVLKDFEMEIIDEAEPKYACDCSNERVLRAIISLGKSELESLIKEQGKAEITCHFCDKVYNFSKSDLEQLLIKCKR